MEQRRRLRGEVISNKMDKTVVVRVDRTVRHRRYGKVMGRSKKYKAHDEEHACRVGDLVTIVESRPISREKRWCVEEIVKRTDSVGLTEAKR
ncbi:MAG: 30S ribosomal protein S17 [Anaerolineae bacterium]|nr:30S ribosomal protein S17 [Anaerolineae bacterium]